MARLNAFLLVALVACALPVITSQHRARKLFIDLEQAQGAAKKLDEEWTQLQLEQGTWATHKRVESVASKSLGMRLPDPASTRIIAAPSAAEAKK
jgi:cell division protein FtsL